MKNNVKSLIGRLNDVESTVEECNELVFARTNIWLNAPTIIAEDEGLYEKEGLSVAYLEVENGRKSKEAVLEGRADVGLVAAAPLAIGLGKDEGIVILGSYMKSKKLLSLISRVKIKDSECAKPPLDPESSVCQKLLKSMEPIYYIPQTVSEIYLYKVLEKYNLRHLLESIKGRSDKNSEKFSPDDIPTKFLNGEINTAVVWEPTSSLITNPLEGEKSKLGEIYSGPLYTFQIYLITSTQTWEKKKKIIKKFVSAISKASNKINETNEFYREKMEKRFNYPNRWLEDKWNTVNFEFDINSRALKTQIINDLIHVYNATFHQNKIKIKQMFKYVDGIEKDINN